jgi:hypothetical protein
MKKAIINVVIDVIIKVAILVARVFIYSTLHVLPVIFAVNVTFEIVKLVMTVAVKVVVKTVFASRYKETVDDIKLMAAVYLLAK